MIIDCPICGAKLQPSPRYLNDKSFTIALDYKCSSHLSISAYENSHHIYMSRIVFRKFSILGFHLYDSQGNLLEPRLLELDLSNWHDNTETTLNNLPIFVEKAQLYLKDYIKYQAFL